MKNEFRSSCPVTSALDIVGDKWTLVIVKQMLLEGKKTFKDFSECEEAIATNILSTRLKSMESFGFVRKESLPHNKKTKLYVLTEKGLSLAPIVIELAIWASSGACGEEHKVANDERLNILIDDKEKGIQNIITTYKELHWEKV
ncbi:MAG: winged helix-turn-helix transcriptional regulator [Flavicella sp.]